MSLTVVVVFVDKSITQKVMDAARRQGVVSRFVWIVCDAWTSASSHRGVDLVFPRSRGRNKQIL